MSVVWLSLAAIAVGSTSARADTGLDATKHAAETYFRGEFVQGFAWLGTGLASTAGGVALARGDDALGRGAGYAFVGAGAIQIIAGVVSFVSPPLRARRAARQIASGHVEDFLLGERGRVARVDRAFGIIGLTEIVAFAGGLTTAALAYGYDRRTLTGAGLGIAAEAATMFVLDLLAHRRLLRYHRDLGVALETLAWR
jgi:hypothetical protein